MSSPTLMRTGWSKRDGRASRPPDDSIGSARRPVQPVLFVASGLALRLCQIDGLGLLFRGVPPVLPLRIRVAERRRQAVVRCGRQAAAPPGRVGIGLPLRCISGCMAASRQEPVAQRSLRLAKALEECFDRFGGFAAPFSIAFGSSACGEQAEDRGQALQATAASPSSLTRRSVVAVILIVILERATTGAAPTARCRPPDPLSLTLRDRGRSRSAGASVTCLGKGES